MSSDYTVLRDEQRRRLNEKSKPKAVRDHEPWTEDEDEFILVEWIKRNPCDRDEATIAECLGRTIIACRRRAQDVRALHGMSNPGYKKENEPKYIGAEDDPEDQWWSADYYNGGGSYA